MLDQVSGDDNLLKETFADVTIPEERLGDDFGALTVPGKRKYAFIILSDTHLRRSIHSPLLFSP